MRKILGISAVLLLVVVVTALVTPAGTFLSAYNLENLLRRSALFGIIGIGAGLVIISGGIDLSIGSIVCLVGCLTPWLIVTLGHSPWLVVPALLLVAAALGFSHGMLVTKLRLQPFLVTLCGLFIYRGVTRGLVSDRSVGFANEVASLRAFGNGRIPITDSFALPAPLLVLIVVAVTASLLLRRTVWGRHLRDRCRPGEDRRLSPLRAPLWHRRPALRVRHQYRPAVELRQLLRALRHRRGGPRRLFPARR